MVYKKKLILLVVLVIIVAAIQQILPYAPKWVDLYSKFLFRPYQSVRNALFGLIPISIGDLLYITFAVLIIYTLVRWVYFLIKIKTHRHKLWASFLNVLNVFCIVYLLFFIGWGGNYYKPSLSEHWQLDKSSWTYDSTLAEYDHYLIGKLNEYALHYEGLPFKEVKKRAQHYYGTYTDCKTKLQGLNIKPSLFNFMMQYMGIQGYYNPITGEAQVNRYLPKFMLPFVVSHELAHQAGIAAEDDANLLAFVLGVETKDTSFMYSAYFNIWLYTHHRMFIQDSTKANELKSQLNGMTLAHLDTLRDIRSRYRTEFSNYSLAAYDKYLKMLQQKEGLGSYKKATVTAWAWENANDSLKAKRISIP